MGFGKVQARGQVTIPADVRQAAEIRAGDTLLFEVTGAGQLRVVVLPTHPSLDDLFDRYSLPEKFESDRVWAEVDQDMSRDALGLDAEAALREVAATTVEGAQRATKTRTKRAAVGTAAKRPAKAPIVKTSRSGSRNSVGKVASGHGR